MELSRKTPTAYANIPPCQAAEHPPPPIFIARNTGNLQDAIYLNKIKGVFTTSWGNVMLVKVLLRYCVFNYP